MDAGSAPVGWYPDPGGGAALRWWDGERWTEHTYATSPDPAGEESGPVRPPTVGGGAHPGPARQQAPGRGEAPREWGADESGAGQAQQGWSATQPGWGAVQPGAGEAQQGWSAAQPGLGATPPGWGAAPGSAGWGAAPGSAAWGGQQPAGGFSPGGLPLGGGWRRNRYAFITFGVGALYVLLAVITHVVFIGIVPIFMAIRSVRSRERLGPLAVVVAIAVIAVSIAVANT